MTRQFTGRHMAGILVCFFAVIIAVNVLMARFATSTFGGEVVENSYVASQHFNRWLAEAANERTLGLKTETARLDDGRLAVSIRGPRAAALAAVARHPLGRLGDRELTFARASDDRFVSHETLPVGRWRLRLAVTAQGRTWHTEQELF